MKKMIYAFLVLLPLSGFAHDQFAGSWKIAEAKINFYSEMGTVPYENCPVELNISVKPNGANEKIVTINQLKATCSSPDFWDFNQFLPVTTFIVSTRTHQVTLDGKDAGTMTAHKMYIKYDRDGEFMFLEGTLNSEGQFQFEWSLRSYETVNFDLNGTLSKVLTNHL